MRTIIILILIITLISSQVNASCRYSSPVKHSSKRVAKQINAYMRWKGYKSLKAIIVGQTLTITGFENYSTGNIRIITDRIIDLFLNDGKTAFFIIN